jgi:hypothetical protein
MIVSEFRPSSTNLEEKSEAAYAISIVLLVKKNPILGHTAGSSLRYTPQGLSSYTGINLTEDSPGLSQLQVI